MIKELRLSRWKSFDSATLHIDTVTVLIGTNASGKSNAIDSLRFLQRIAAGKDLVSSISGEAEQPGIRGGADWLCLTRYFRFRIEVVVQVGETDYEYELTVMTLPRLLVQEERLVRIAGKSRMVLFRTDPVSDDQVGVVARLYNSKAGKKHEFSRFSVILSQMRGLLLRKEIYEGVQHLLDALSGIFVLDPIPSHMRGYSALRDQLYPDASNIAGVLASLDAQRKKEVEKELVQFASRVPEHDIERVWAQKVGQFESDAMLYCKERGVLGQEGLTVDARGMSDGTLRFLAILTALLTRPEGSLLVVEEVDNGLHPSRASLLLRMLREVGARRRIDVIVTTHNPALLDKLDPELIPFITVVHRDPTSGHSMLTLLEDIERLPKLLAAGSLGRLATEGLLEDAAVATGHE